jgi:hypothetical protein
MRITQTVVTARFRHILGSQIISDLLATTLEPRHKPPDRIEIETHGFQRKTAFQVPLGEGVNDPTKNRELTVLML